MGEARLTRKLIRVSPNRIYGLLSGVLVWVFAILVTLPIGYITALLVPLVMWVTLRWMEDGLSSLRAAIALLSILAVGKKRLSEIRAMRQELHGRVMRVAVERGELPPDPEVVFDRDSDKRDGGRALERGGKVGRLGYFSMRRRRKKDYNEVRCILTVSCRLVGADTLFAADYEALGSFRVSDVRELCRRPAVEGVGDGWWSGRISEKQSQQDYVYSNITA